MKKTLLIALALMLGFSMSAQKYNKVPITRVSKSGIDKMPSTKDAAKDSPQWQMINNPFTTTDIYGNTVNVADTLAAGKFIVIDYSATWCNPCYNFHQSKKLEHIYNTLGSQVCVLWVEAESRNTTQQIYGTSTSSGYDGYTCGDWTHYSDGSSVSYPIIDCYTCHDMVNPYDYVPEVDFVTPNGYYCQIYGETWGVGTNMSDATVISNIQNLMANYPQAGVSPTGVTINGPSKVFIDNNPSYSVSYVSVDPVTNITWAVDNGTVTQSGANGENAVITFTAPGVNTLTVTVTNTTGSTTETMDILVRDSWNFGDEMDYSDGGDYESAIGLQSGEEFEWGVKYPASLLSGRNYVTKVSAYINDGVSGQYTVRVYQGNTPSTPVSMNSFNVTSAQTDQWHDFVIPGGVQINPAQDLWITLSTTGYAASYTEYNGDPNGSYLGLNGTWYTLMEATQGNYEGTWMIKTTTSASAPAFDFTINGPTSGSDGSNITFNVSGPSDATYNWTLQGATPSTATGMTATASWANAGTYNITVNGTRGSSTVSHSMQITIASCGISTLPYNQGFENGITCWTILDEDGDGYTWGLATANGFNGYSHSGSDAIASASYINQIGALTPDNWIISPVITVPSNGATLEWWSGAIDASYHNDYYSVLVSTNGTDPTNFTGQLYAGENESGNYTQHSKSLSAYAGQQINIAFRHHNCNDVYWLLIDDIKLTSGSVGVDVVNDIKTNVYPNPTDGKVYVSAEDFVSVEVLDMNGRVVKTSNEKSVDMSNFANGVYMFRILTANGTTNLKVVKK